MSKRGWKSKDTLSKALAELRDKDWIEVTRQGGRHSPSLYAVTFYAIHSRCSQQNRYPAHRVNLPR